MPDEPTVPTAAPGLSRDEVALRALLGETATIEDARFAGLGKMRTFTAGTYALLQETWNEWLFCAERAQMKNRGFATLAWLYIQSGPLDEVRRTCFEATSKFNAAVLAWSDRTDAAGEPLFTAQMLDAAADLIEGMMAAKKAADFTVKPRPVEPGVQQDDPPPN
jgi:hypothetical protein